MSIKIEDVPESHGPSLYTSVAVNPFESQWRFKISKIESSLKHGLTGMILFLCSSSL
jgi:hypothetical protein